MKRQMFFATAFSAALAVGAAAQTGTGTATTPQQDTKAQQVTMTGCLERSAAGTAGTAGTATGTPSSAAAAGFILSNASAGSGSSASGTSGTSGTGAAGTSSSPGAKYRLMGGDQEDLTKYVNSKVEIRGTLDRSSASSATGAAAGTSASGQSSDNLPTLRVTSVKQIAASCAGGN
jgi:hypothetical protein